MPRPGHELSRVEVLPPLIRSSLGVPAVQGDQQRDELAPNRGPAQEIGKLGETDQPVRVPRRPVLIGAVGDPVDDVVRFARLVQQLAYLGDAVIHGTAPSGPPKRVAGGSRVVMGRSAGLADRLDQVPLPHLRPPGDVLPRGHLVQVLPGAILEVTAGLSAALPRLRGLPAEIGAHRFRQLADRLLLAGGLLGALDVAPGRLSLSLRRHRAHLPQDRTLCCPYPLMREETPGPLAPPTLGLASGHTLIDAPEVIQVPRESYPRLFLRFLRFGLLAWGGPVAQIAMVRDELVERERWISRERFNRVLAVYQVLPGPEAHELCVYFGYISRGRVGGLLAGLGFMLPGFVLMLALSWAYVAFGIAAIAPQGLFYGFQAEVLALIVRAIYRIGSHVLVHPWLWGIAVAALAADLVGVHFGVTLAVAGSFYAAVRRRQPWWAVLAVALGALLVALVPALRAGGDVAAAAPAAPVEHVPVLRLFGAGLLAGLLSFGGAYTAIPLLRREAGVSGGWVGDPPV